ncbi:Na(+)/H(+) antiporter subunit D [Desulfonatronum lacustre]|uniref:Na(+)/H(+) antiporter subunit D n=1 Tax=Desulfonatronum lacustre TaxID=66849 RepID=UPI00048C6D22|nr:Na(+)/H(+) antiporter subunit D [Desulfonatronum lacustre]
MTSFFHPTIAFFGLGLVLLLLARTTVTWWRWLLPLAPILAIIAVFSATPGDHLHLRYLGMDLSLGRLDGLSLLFANVFAIQALIGFIYAFHLKEIRHHVAAAVYVGGAFGCVFAGDYVTLFIFWEIMSVASTLLIWFNSKQNPRAVGAGIRYFVIHTIGGLMMLAGILLRYQVVGDFTFTGIIPADAQYYDWLIMLGFGVNAAFVIAHAWLPDAYPEATIPGAVFMSAFTTKTAVYVLARGFAGWEFLAWMGVAMALWGVFYATMENNARRILSYHIMSQVGYMVAGIGIGTAMTLNGTCAHAYAHILYKGLLFMSVGAVLYAAGTAKLNELGGLAGRLPLVMLAYVVAGLSISGMPIFNGFVSKTMTIAGAFNDHQVLLGMLMEVAAVGTFLSVGLKLPYFAFWGGKPTYDKPLKPIPVNMYIAMGAAAFLCIAQGLYPDLLYRFLPYPGAYDFQPWSSWKVLMTLMLLGFTGLGFMVMRGVLKPHAQRNLDFETLYIYLGRAFLALVSWPLAKIDAIWSEVYERVGLVGLLFLGKITSWFDKMGIDFVLDNSAIGAREAGGILTTAQTGRLQDYLALAIALAAGIGLLVWYLA